MCIRALYFPPGVEILAIAYVPLNNSYPFLELSHIIYGRDHLTNIIHRVKAYSSKWEVRGCFTLSTARHPHGYHDSLWYRVRTCKSFALAQFQACHVTNPALFLPSLPFLPSKTSIAISTILGINTAMIQPTIWLQHHWCLYICWLIQSPAMCWLIIYSLLIYTLRMHYRKAPL